MCELRSNKAGDKGLSELRKSGQRNLEGRLIRLANDDDVLEKRGLELLLEELSDWRHRPEIRHVRKYRVGRHRFYFTGQHTDCRYILIHVKVNKRTEEDREETPEFRNKILKALSYEETRLLG